MSAARRTTSYRTPIVPMLLALALAASSLDAATFVVDTLTDSHDASPGDGVCADGAANCTLRAAIEEANAWSGHDTVSLGPGDHVVDLVIGNPANGVPLEVLTDMDIVGAGAGATTISVDDVAFIGAGALEVTSTGVGPGVHVSDLRIDVTSGGYGIVAVGNCGGPACAPVVVEDVELLATTAPPGVFGTSLYLVWLGGSGGQLTLRRASVFAPRTPAGFAIANATGGLLTFEDCDLSGGGELSIGVQVAFGGSLALRRTHVHDLADSGQTLDAGISANLFSGAAVSILVEDSEIYAAARGVRIRNGGIGADLTMTGSTVTDIGHEGFLVEGPFTALIGNSTVSGAGSGVALATPTGGAGTVSLDLDRVTLTGNGTSVSIAGGSGTLTALGSILANGGTECVGTLTSAGYNLVEGACTITPTLPSDVLGVDPMLEPLADNGGRTRTHALDPASLGIDTGPIDPVDCGTEDQRGFVRPFDGDSAGGARCDIGAWELSGDIARDDFETGSLTGWDAIAGWIP
ncbi:MAG: CSLREA domain-containing protein [Holophagales bacterium]|nr:CSLREA domain-containing protein [Holophagales bacterium]